MSIIENAKLIFVTGAYLMDKFDGVQMAEFMKRCKTLGKTTALDVCWNAEGEWKILDGVLPYVDIFMPSIDEAEQISDKSGLSEMADVFFDKGVGSSDENDNENYSSMYTDPDTVNDFISRAEVDALAIAIGTAHGAYKTKPRLDIERLKTIYNISEKPLVLHGGSGLSDTDFRNTIDNGIRKINICTELCNAVYDAYSKSHERSDCFEKAVITAKDAVKDVVKTKLRLFGSSGKA